MQNGYTEIIPTRWGNMVSLKCDGHITGALTFYGESTPDEVMICLSFINEGNTVVDVGANIGTFTVPFAQAVGRKGSVIAFEPQRVVHQCLCANLAINSLSDYVDAVRAAVGKSDGTENIQVINPFLANNNVGGVRLNSPDVISEPVNLVRLDSLELPRLDFLKIDVEGMEHEVLIGSAETVTRCKPVIFAECLPGDEKNETGLREFFTSHGYHSKRIVSPLFSPRNARRSTIDIFGEQYDHNILALPDGIAFPSWLDKYPAFQ